MKINVSLIRHGMTPGNQEHRYVGRTDEGLMEQARQELDIKKDDFPYADRVICSPMKRCRQTAEIIFPYQTAEICPGLEEMDFGAFEYKNYKELSGNPQYQAWIDSNGTLPFPAGEDLMSFKQRCRDSFQRCLQKIRKNQFREAVNDDLSVAFVVHGGTIMAVMEAFAEEKKSYYDWQVKNGCGYQTIAEINEENVTLKNISNIG